MVPRVRLTRQVRVRQDPAWLKPVGNLLEELRPSAPVQDELRHHEARGRVMHFRDRQCFEIAMVEITAGCESSFFHIRTAGIEHGGRGFHGGEAPPGESLGQVYQLPPRSDPDAEDPGHRRQLSEDGIQDVVQTIVDGRHPGPVPVLACCLPLEDLSDLISSHASTPSARLVTG